jgi:two-component system LytT family response regulator
MSYRSVIVDDEKPARERIKRLLAGHADFVCVGEANDAASAIELIDRVEPDLCFLDVQMPEGDGFSVLEGVHKLPLVIFTTAYDEYAVRAFEIGSLDYLLKPFDKQRFAEALERAQRALDRPALPAARILELLEDLRRGSREERPDVSAASRPARISARRGAKILLLDPDEVLWFEAEDTLVFARTVDGRALVERTLAALEQQLTRFFRAHRSCLVNLDQIAEIIPGDAGMYSIVFRDEQRSSVPLSRRQARRLRELIPW